MATRELTAREKALLSRAREKEEWDYVRRPPKRPVTFSEPETVEQYLGRVGLSAWRPHFQAHLPENCKSVALVRATTAEDLQHMARQANFALDEPKIRQVLRALDKPTTEPPAPLTDIEKAVRYYNGRQPGDCDEQQAELIRLIIEEPSTQVVTDYIDMWHPFGRGGGGYADMLSGDALNSGRHGCGRTALWWAVAEDRVAIATLLVARGASVGRPARDSLDLANPHFPDGSLNHGWSPLHRAVVDGNAEMVKALLDAKGSERDDPIKPDRHGL